MIYYQVGYIDFWRRNIHQTMNKFIILISIFGFVTSVLATEFGLNSQEWIDFKRKHGKTYSNKIEEIARATIYAKNKAYIDGFNADDSQGFKLAINHLADLTDAEYKTRLGYRHQANKNSSALNKGIGEAFLAEVLNRPIEVSDSVDWRKVPGRVSGIKDQGNCGSCWAFSAVGAMEGQELPVTGSRELVPLSEQNILDCTKKDFGCNGGWPKDAFDQVAQEGGIDDEKSYPYAFYNPECWFDKKTSVMTVKGSSLLKEADEEQLRATVAKFGPVSVAIDSSLLGFRFYHSGVYRPKHCGKVDSELDHAVLVVGYGTDEKGGDYWIVKNSWGLDWGDSGYIKMARNANNTCGIATEPIIPVV